LNKFRQTSAALATAYALRQVKSSSRVFFLTDAVPALPTQSHHKKTHSSRFLFFRRLQNFQTLLEIFGIVTVPYLGYNKYAANYLQTQRFSANFSQRFDAFAKKREGTAPSRGSLFANTKKITNFKKFIRATRRGVPCPRACARRGCARTF
jgi:hypothetical protein